MAVLSNEVVTVNPPRGTFLSGRQQRSSIFFVSVHLPCLPNRFMDAERQTLNNFFGPEL